MTPVKPGPVRRRIALEPTNNRNFRDWFFRILVAAALLASVTLAWWTFTKRVLPLQKQSRQLTSTMAQLSAQVDDLQRKWPAAAVEQTRAEYRETYTRLFADEAALRAWLDHLEELAAPLGLDVEVDFGKSAPQAASKEKLAVIPTSITLTVRPASADGESPYQRLLRLTAQLAAEGKRADLAELSVNGGAESVTRAVLVFNLWAGEGSGRK